MWALFSNGWDAQPVLPYQYYKWLGCTASLIIIINITKQLGCMVSVTISSLQMAGMHSQYYHINITKCWDIQPILTYLPYKWLGCTATITISTLQMAGMRGQYYDITNGCDAQWVLSHGYRMNIQCRFFQQLGYRARCKLLSQPAGMHSSVHCTMVSFTVTG